MIHSLGMPRFGTLKVDEESLNKAAKGQNMQQPPVITWNDVKSVLPAELAVFEACGGVDLRVSGEPVPQMETYLKNEGGALRAVRMARQILYKLQAVLIGTEQPVGKPDEFVVPINEDYRGLRAETLNYLYQVQRPIDDSWPMGKALDEVVKPFFTIHFRPEWMETLWKIREQDAETADLSFLPYYKEYLLPRLSEKKQQILAEATPQDWLQYFWAKLTPKAREALCKKLSELHSDESLLYVEKIRRAVVGSADAPRPQQIS